MILTFRMPSEKLPKLVKVADQDRDNGVVYLVYLS